MSYFAKLIFSFILANSNFVYIAEKNEGSLDMDHLKWLSYSRKTEISNYKKGDNDVIIP